jgi:adenylate cyclase
MIHSVNFRLLKLSPIIVAGAVGLVLVLLEYAMDRVPAFDFMRRLEWVTFDWRVRQSLRFDQPTAANLGAVYVDDKTLHQVQTKLKISWPFPRWLHGAVLKELTDQKVAGVAYDIFFLDERPGDKPVPSTTPGQTVPSDRHFADEIRRNGNVILGAPDDPLSPSRLRLPAPIFNEAAAAAGHALRFTDADGVVRRVEPVFVDADGRRIWQLGLALAARHMGLDLARAQINEWKILVPDAANQMHEIPLDGAGRLVIRWVLPAGESPALREAEMTEMLGAVRYRQKRGGAGDTAWQGRLVVVGSAGTNPPIADRGPTPTGPATPYCSIYWNVANTILTRGYVHTMDLWTRLLIIGVLVPLIGLLSWRIRAAWSTLAVFLVAAAYLAFCMWSYVVWGWWLPVALPLIGAIFVTYSSMVVYRFFFERYHRRRLRGMFAPLLAPDALELLLQQPNISWKPQEKVMTVIFADIRGFTAFTDQANATEDAGQDPERAARAEREALATVNVYLAAIAETLKQHGATMDKYMGDAVMAFWGAPLPQPDHAAASVRAAIAAQRAIARINEERQRENVKLGAANVERAAKGEPPLPLLPTLTLGTGINTGRMTVGFMGSESHLSNYTVFGRAVNIAARLEGASGSGRIFITNETREAAVTTDPGLTDCMRPLGEIAVKGIATPLEVIEVIWREEGAAPVQERDAS